MAKFLCACGRSISTSGAIPNPIEWHCISDSDLDLYIDKVDPENFYRQAVKMYKCPESGHLYIFWADGSTIPTGYEPIGK
jgi:hypothetical protein